MNSRLKVLVSFIAPVAITFLVYSQLGPIWGYIIFGIFILFAIYKSRSFIFANRANKKYSNGDFNGALNDLKAAVAVDPKQVRVRGSYAYLLLKIGYTDEASVQIEDALKGAQLPQDKNSLRLTKGLVMWKQNKIDEAITELTNLLEVYETTNVYASLGFLYIAKGDLKEALEFNLKAKEYNSSNAIILDNLGTTYIMVGEYDKAYEIYQEVMKLKPKFPEAYYNYARVLVHIGDLEKALYMARTAVSLRFWNISTIKKEEAEELVRNLEVKSKSLENSVKEAEENSSQEIESDSTPDGAEEN